MIRFKDGAVDAEVASKGLARGFSSDAGDGADVDTLPASTAAVLSVSLPQGWLDDFVDQIKGTIGEEIYDQAVQEAEQETGLKLPDDVETLLGDGFTVSADATPTSRSSRTRRTRCDVPAGMRIKGDADKITPIIDKIKAAVGEKADDVVVDSSGDLVAVGTNPDYVSQAAGQGRPGLAGVVRQRGPRGRTRPARCCTSNFDAGDGWAEELADLLSDGDPGAKANIEPLDALGISGWVDDDSVAARTVAAHHRLSHPRSTTRGRSAECLWGVRARRYAERRNCVS